MKSKTVSKILLEGALIVISVLAALFIDDYKDRRQEGENEIKYLKSIREDLVRDTVYFAHRFEDFDIMVAYNDSLLNILESNGKQEIPNRFLVKNYLADSSYVIPFEYTIFSILLPINFQNSPSYESMKQNGDLKLIKDFSLQLELNKHYASSGFMDNAANAEVKRINELRRRFIDESRIPFSWEVDKLTAELYLKEPKLRNIMYDSREVLQFVSGVMDQKKSKSKQLINIIDDYLNG
jgi:hypothetical protein